MKIAQRQLLELLDRSALRELSFTAHRLLVAVSGGADSVAMLYALSLFYRQGPVELFAVHVNHGLRESADADAELVRAHCRQCGVPLTEYRLDLAEKPKGLSPEQHWRRARYKKFRQALDETQSDFVAVGHNANDLAETFLFHLARGTGPTGLVFSFHSEVEDVPVMRPLWKTLRPEIEAALTANEIPWATDESNSDERYSRNLIRNRIIPALEEVNPVAVQSIVSLSGMLHRALDFRHAETVRSFPEPSDHKLDISGSIAFSDPDIQNAIRDFVKAETSLIADSAKVEQAVAIIRRGGGALVSLSGAQTLVITQEYAWICPGQEPDHCALATAHTSRWGDVAVDFEETQWSTNGSWQVAALDGRLWEVAIDSRRKLGLRNRREGDRIAGRFLKKLMIETRVPWYLRDYLPVVVDKHDNVIDVISEAPMLNEWIKRRCTEQLEICISPV